jgi:hypothetical protein
MAFVPKASRVVENQRINKAKLAPDVSKLWQEGGERMTGNIDDFDSLHPLRHANDAARHRIC